VADLGPSEAAPSDLKLLALKVAYLERVNDELRARLRRIERVARIEHEHG
jgi:hypothetical protein